MKKYLAIDVGGSSIKYAIIDMLGSVLATNKVKTPRTKNEFITTLFSIVQTHKENIEGIGLGIPGKVDPNTQTILHGGALKYLHECPLGRLLEEEFSMPVVLENDGKCAAIGEYWLGNLQGVQDGAAVVLGTGVGGGIILDGKCRQGFHHKAGEISFMVTNSAGESVDFFAGSNSSAIRLISNLANCMNLSDETDGPTVFACLSHENEKAWKMFQKYCLNVAIIIHNIQTVVDIEKFVIGGGISHQSIVIQEINHQLDELYNFGSGSIRTITKPKIEASKFYNDANLYGAIYPLIEKDT